MPRPEHEPRPQRVRRRPHGRVRHERRAQQQHREPPRQALRQLQEGPAHRTAVPHQCPAHQQRPAGCQRRDPRPGRPGRRTDAGPSLRSRHQPPCAFREHEQQAVHDFGPPFARRPHADTRRRHRDQGHPQHRPQPGRLQLAPGRVHGGRQADPEVPEDDARPRRTDRHQRHPLAPVGSRVPCRPVHQPHRQREQQQRGDTDRRGDAGERVGADQFGAVRKQPEHGGDPQRAARSAVRVRRADPQRDHHHGEHTEPQPSRHRTAEEAGAQAGRMAAHARQQGRSTSGHLDHARHAPNDTRFPVVTGEPPMCRSIYVYVLFRTKGRPVTQTSAVPLPPPEERRRLREAGALTQAQVAERVGVSRETVRAWESGRTAPRGRRRDAYAQLLWSIADKTGVRNPRKYMT